MNYNFILIMNRLFISLIVFALTIGQFSVVAANTSNYSSQYNKAVSFINDNDASNDDLAINMLIEAANNNHALSARYLGMMSWCGKLSEVNKTTAYEWLIYADELDVMNNNRSREENHQNATNKSFTYYYLNVYSVTKGTAGHDDCKAKIKTLKKVFPQFIIEQKFDAPYWRINIGVFLTKAEAEAIAKIISKNIPQFNDISICTKVVNYR